MMQTYPVDESHALYIDENTAILICLKQDLLHGDLPADVQKAVDDHTLNLNDLATQMRLIYDLGYGSSLAVDILQDADVNGMVWVSSFTGTAESVDMDDAFSLEDNLGDDYLIYILPDRKFTPFAAAYDSVDEMLDEFKDRLSDLLPDDFDYRKHLCSICGTYYG